MTSVARTLVARTLPRRDDFPSSRGDWTADLVAGITVGVVALPLALGFGIGAGLGATAGLITAIVAGIVAALFGGSHLQVSGPTGAMTVVLVPIVAQYGVGAVPLLAILAGVMVIAAGLLGLGRAVSLVPWPVVEGFTVGIAVIIFLQQVPLLLDAQVEGESNVVVSAIDAVRGATWSGSAPALLVCTVVVALMVVLRIVRPTFPGSLVAVIVGTVTSIAFGLDVATIGEVALGDVTFGVDLPAGDAVRSLVQAAGVIALLAALESLLSARVADGMSDRPATDPDRELVGQGLANVASGLFGGMPATGAIARTAVNVRAGARTRMASLLHGVVLLVVLLGASPLVEEIPLAALAGVLMVTATRMVDVAAVRAILRASRSDALVFVATAFTTIAFDLVLAVEVGFVISMVLVLRASARASSVEEEDVEVDAGGADADRLRELMREHVVVYRLEGSLFFGAAQRFLDEVTSLDRARVVVLRLGWLHVLDASGAHAVVEMVESLEHRGIRVLVCGIRARHRQVLEAVGIPGEHVDESHVFTDLDSALQRAHELVTA
jgi:SulP family sulfate permease